MAAVKDVAFVLRSWISEQTSWIEHPSRREMSLRAFHISGSSRTEVRRPKTVMFRLTSVLRGSFSSLIWDKMSWMGAEPE
jgi:hypothetical protein